MTAWRFLLRLGLGLAGLVSGTVWYGCPAYGVAMYGPPDVPHDPTVAIEDFSYSPAGPVAPGTTIEFTLKTNKPTNAGYAYVLLGIQPGASKGLNDDGIPPDAAAYDGIWSGDWLVTGDLAPGTLPVTAHLDWFDGYPGTELSGTPLTIVEPEGE